MSISELISCGKRSVMNKRYISYFQSVTTLGILTDGNDKDEAHSKAKNKLKKEEGVDHCFFDQTPFDLVATEEWEPEIEAEKSKSGLSFNFNPSDETKNVIATRLHKDVSDLTNVDYETFVKDSIQKALNI